MSEYFLRKLKGFIVDRLLLKMCCQSFYGIVQTFSSYLLGW